MPATRAYSAPPDPRRRHNDHGRRESASTTARPTRTSWASGACWPATPSSTGCRPPPACAGWTWAAATARSRSCWSSAARPRGAGHRPVRGAARVRAHASRAGAARRSASGDAMALPYADGAFDAAVMALVIFFVPEPAQGVAEMARVIRPGGGVCAYAWDILGGGFPYFALQDEMAELGQPAAVAAQRGGRAHGGAAPVVDRRRPGRRRDARARSTRRTFADFDAWWAAARKGPRIAPRLSELPAGDAERAQGAPARAPGCRGGRQHHVSSARANAVRGRRPD